MYWWWKIRIYRPDGHYAICQVKTVRSLHDIDVIQDFYHELTANKMLLEGMSETPFEGVIDLAKAFGTLWEPQI